MKLPITEEYLEEFKRILREKEENISDERIEHAQEVANLINYAYNEGYSKAKNEMK